jgi:DNA polymerase
LLEVASPRASASERRERLVEVYREAAVCERCPLAATRTQVVFGNGNSDAELMFVGEAPGAEEDRQGLPFVGRAGQLLNQLLEEIGMSRDDVFIANVLKSRPPGNRDPQPEEIGACEPYLWDQVRLIEPKVVCTLGNFATKLLSGSQTGITKVRGVPQVHRLGVRTVYLLPLLHPAAALHHDDDAEKFAHPPPELLCDIRQGEAGFFLGEQLDDVHALLESGRGIALRCGGTGRPGRVGGHARGRLPAATAFSERRPTPQTASGSPT